MPSLCCFWCPAKDFQVRKEGEQCPTCQRDFNAPLLSAPTTIGDYTIEAPISRGFYGAVYRAKQNSLLRTVVLKVVPVGIYSYFGKDWAAECVEHAELAEGTPLIAAITDRFDALVSFGDASLDCHVAVLANIPGPTLQQLLDAHDEHGITPRAAAQIAADLFAILHAFSQKERFHNDLHAGNVIVQRLTGSAMRQGAIDSSIRTVAVDLGSVKDASLSGDGKRFGDHTHVARQISSLAKLVNARGDLDHRISTALRGLAEHLAPKAASQRLMTSEDALRILKDAIGAADEPWRQNLSLARFGDGYNAQALESWHVPSLWFDPEGKWLAKTTVRGPQVITGMRGCGKTMLLRALHFHARASQRGRDTSPYLTDDFVGLYASCQKLLDPQDYSGSEPSASSALPFERLFIAYLRDATQVLRHLRSLDPAGFTERIDLKLAGALQVLESPAPPPIASENDFEQYLTNLQFGLADGSSGCRLKLAPAEAFSHLAGVIRSAAGSLSSRYVLFLLDDVSTRYLHPEMVREVISQLLFQHGHCAFRITTEAQALHRVLLSPGGSAPADPARDYEEFDLGHEVYRFLQEGSIRDRLDFISEILIRRGRQFTDAIYQRNPIDVLGDVPLEEIAREIATSSPTSRARKQVYRGLRALQAVCVGDIGDVVKLYEKILQRADLGTLPVPSLTQTECFLQHSAGLMHYLNRRDQQKKSLALAFAQASGELLHRSSKDSNGRLRQYTKLYVRVDTGPNFEQVSNSLLDLLDAGVFVYDGGVPRTKTRDSDPVLQFKLSFRKTLGLASFIGLADRDRFELSGDLLRTWLDDASRAKQILLDSETRSAAVDVDLVEAEATSPADAMQQSAVGSKAAQTAVDRGTAAEVSAAGTKQLPLALPLRIATPTADVCAPDLRIRVTKHVAETSVEQQIDVLVLALGFEERTQVSAERVLRSTRPVRIVLVSYGDQQGDELYALIRSKGIDTTVVSTLEQLAAALPDAPARIVIDSTGLSKPFLFVAVRDALRKTRRVSVLHTLAVSYYPRNEDLSALGVTVDGPVSEDVFTRTSDILMGEHGPYRHFRVHHEAGSPDRARTLIASASPKNDRLLYLLDQRPCDATRILVPKATTARRRMARASAELAASAADANVSLEDVDTNDVEAALRASERLYNDFYLRSGANVELGLTGSKMHAVAFAALAASVRISAAWYVAPASFDKQRFTEGAASTERYEIELDSEHEAGGDGSG